MTSDIDRLRQSLADQQRERDALLASIIQNMRRLEIIQDEIAEIEEKLASAHGRRRAGDWN